MTFTAQLRWRFGDVDAAGIAYYPKLLHAFHCAFEDWWSDGLGRPYAEVMRDEHLGLPAVRLEADFRAPVRFGDDLDVHLGVLRVGTSSVELGFWMTKFRGDEALCRLRVVTAAVDVRTMTKLRLPAKWREAFAPFALAEADFPSWR